MLQNVAYFHSRGRVVGPDAFLPENIILLESSTGPEPVLLLKDGVSTNEEDIRAAGALLSYIWTFGSRVPDIMKQGVITRMTARDGALPTIGSVLKDPAFWSSSRVMDFLMSVSDVLELKQRLHISAIEKEGATVYNRSWLYSLALVLQEKVERDSQKRRQYSGTCVRDLLRVVRNLAHHYYELAPEVRAALGSREGLGDFWVSTFPHLLRHTYAAMEPFMGATNCARIAGFYTV